jgi:alkanesulfonate monooxygenase SsuD/methylene tetrahydromethanopterin reductase-like flavin-dependent oxidoreductase (luciferase family)
MIIAATISDPRLNDPDWASARLAQAEAAGIDLLILGSPGHIPFDPLVLAAWAAPRTTHMHIVATVPASLSHPFHVARALSAIDFLCDGRSGWCPVPAGAPAGMTEDMVAGARSLWDGWGADTLIIDKESGRYLDSSQVRPSNYEGPFFRVAGPVNAMRPPQGHPLLVVDGASPLALDDADFALIGPGETAKAKRVLAKIGLGDAVPDGSDGVHFTLTDPERELAAFPPQAKPGEGDHPKDGGGVFAGGEIPLYPRFAAVPLSIKDGEEKGT